jgi:hypothetical protein
MQVTLPPLINFYFYEEDAYLIAFDDSMPKFEQFILDFSTDRPILVNENWTGLPCRGLWFDKIMGSRVIEPDQVDVLPYHDDSKKESLQIFLGKYFFDSYL